jgi:hypothetical protein
MWRTSAAQNGVHNSHYFDCFLKLSLATTKGRKPRQDWAKAQSTVPRKRCIGCVHQVRMDAKGFRKESEANARRTFPKSLGRFVASWGFGWTLCPQPTNKESNQSVSGSERKPQKGRRLQQKGAKRANQERKYTEQDNTVITSRLPSH